MEGLNKEQQFLAIYSEYADSVFRHCYFRVSDREKAKDLVQTVFEKTWEYLARGNNIENEKAFIYRIAHNLIIDTYRKKREESLDVMLKEGFDVGNHDHEEIFTMLAHREILDLLNELPPSYKDVIVMRYIDDIAPKDIAKIINKTENAVSVRIHRGLEKLKTLLNK